MTAQILTQEYLHTLFHYKDGELYWKISLSNRVKIGDKAGFLNSNGYYNICIKNKNYTNHRLIYAMHNGCMPKIIDHIDGTRINNKIENLREATVSQNCQNGKLRKNNKSGVKNVHWYKRDKKWCVDLTVNGKLKNFGKFENLELAELVANEARKLYYGDYSREK
jgi:hypothetical protein